MKKKKLFHKIPSKLYGLSLSVLFLSALSGCALLPKEEAVLAPPLVEPAKVEYDVVEVEKGEIIKRVKGNGNLIPQNNQSLSYTQDGGRLKEIHVAAGDMVKKGQTLVEIETGNLLFDIEQLQYDLKKAELRLAQLKEQSADKYSIQIGELDVKSLELRLYQLNQQQAKSKIVSPIDGVVTFVTEIKQGEVVPAYQNVIQVANTKDLQVLYTAMNGSDIADVKVGMEAAATIGKEQVKGKVVQTPSDVPFDVYEQNPDLYGKSLVVSLEKVPEGAEVGGIVEIEVITSKKSDTLIIPKNALRTAMGRNYVQVLLDNTKRELDIEAGIVTSTEVEVLKGLKEGDVIIVK